MHIVLNKELISPLDVSQVPQNFIFLIRKLDRFAPRNYIYHSYEKRKSAERQACLSGAAI